MAILKYETSIENITRAINNDIEQILIANIRADLMERAKATVDEVATKLARDLRAHVQSIRNVDGTVHISLVINDVKTDV